MSVSSLSDNKSTRNISLGINIQNNYTYTVALADSSNIDRTLMQRYFLHEKFKILKESQNPAGLVKILKDLGKNLHIYCLGFEQIEKKELEAIEEVRLAYEQTKILVLARNIPKNSLHRLKELKVNGIILKPFDKEKFNNQLAKMLGRRDLLDKEQIEYEQHKINLKDVKIPSMPAIAIKVLNFDSDQPSGGSAELEEIINPDKSFTSDLLRIANSAYFGRGGSVKTIKDAITLLGLKNVRNIIILQFKKNFVKNLKGDLFKKHLHNLPILTALIAFDLVEPLKQSKLKNEIFINSLLRKIGMTVLALNFTNLYTEVLKLHDTGLKSLYEIEQSKMNITSIRMGLYVFSYWKMPENFLSIVKNQNFPLSTIQQVHDIDRICRLAEFFARKILDIRLSETELNLETELLNFYKAPAELKDLFSEDYYQMIQEHPFFEMYG